jgi:predicted porin
MKQQKRMLSILTILILVSAGTSFAAHPLVSDDAGTLGKGIVQVELNGDISYDKETANGSTTKSNGAQIATTVGVGVADKIDLTLGFTRPWSAGDVDGISFSNAGSADFSMSMKWQVFEREGFSIAVKPQLGYSNVVNSSASDYSMIYALGVVLTKEIEPFALHLNLGYAYTDYNLAEVRDTTRSSVGSFSLGATYELNKKLKLVADFGASTSKDKTSDDMPVFALAGTIYSINKNIDLSVGAKLGLTRPETDVTATFGITIKF